MNLKHKFFKSKIFKKQAARHDAWDEIDDLKIELDVNPEIGAVIPKGDGLRKVRMALSGKGKRGGARVIYYQAVNERILLIDLYSKNEKVDLSADELKAAIGVRNEMLDDLEGIIE